MSKAMNQGSKDCLYTIYLIVARALDLAALRPSAHASKGILALHTKRVHQRRQEKYFPVFMNIDDPEDRTGKPIPSKISRKIHKDDDDNSNGMMIRYNLTRKAQKRRTNIFIHV